MTEEHCREVLNTIVEIQKSIEQEYKGLLELSDTYRERYEQEKAQLPYHLNVIDELHINENGHSRILFKLLNFKNERGEHEMLNSLLEYIRGKRVSDAFDCIKSVKPDITQEKERIDLWVRDKEYAIIFENKVYNASDQEAQLSRYIEKTKKERYKEESIFVVYLSQSGQEPDEQSWGKYKKAFAERYVNLSFRYDIRFWLQNCVLPNIRYKDSHLRCAILQYIDYLDGLFNLRTINEQMNMNLQKIITECFKLDSKNEVEQVCILDEKIEELDELKNQMNGLKEKIRNKYWRDKIREKLSNVFELVEENHYVDVYFKLDGKRVNIHIYSDRKLYCQVEFALNLPKEERQVKTTRLMELMDRELNECNEFNIWKYFKIDDYNGVLDCFLKVIDRCKEMADQ